MRHAVAVLLAIAAVWACAQNARAQAAVGIVVHVHDELADMPVHGALVRLVGSSARRSYLARTDERGDTAFNGALCESGLLLVEAKGYQALRQRVTCDAASVVIDVPLRRELAVIGATRSAPNSPSKATVSITPDSATRRASPTLIAALDQLAGVSAQNQGAGFRAGIRGENSSLTEYSLNGAPLGGSASSLAINSDLLSSASVDESNDAVALFTASPTATRQYASEFRLGSYQDTFQKYQTSGTIHGDGLGYVGVHTSRGIASELDGKSYLDQSGLDYRHRGVLHTTGDLLRLTDSIGATSASLTYSASMMSAQQIPAYYSAGLPAGQGPGTHQDEKSSNPVLFVSMPMRAVQVSLSATAWSASTWTDASSAMLALSPAPQSSFDRVLGSDVTLALSAAPGRNRIVNASVARMTSSSSGTSLAALGGVPFGGSFSTASRTTEVSFAEDWRGNPRLPFGITLKGRSSDRLGGALQATVSAQYVMSPNARLRYAGTFGTKLVDLASDQTSQALPDPASAQFDCSARAAFLSGPGAAGTRAAVANHDVSVSLNRDRSQLTVALYQHSYRHTSIGAVPLVAASLPYGYFAPGFLAAVQQDYRGGCAGDLAPERIFVQQTFTGADVTYRGLSANGHLAISRTWSADVSVGLERARITAGDPRLAATPYYPGSFIPSVPDYKGNLVLGWQRPDAATAALVSITVAGPHNARQLPPYAVVNAAIERRLSPSSSAALLVSNLFDTLTDPFVGTRFAVPLHDAYGRAVPTLASPLLPTRFQFRYTLKFGAPEPFR